MRAFGRFVRLSSCLRKTRSGKAKRRRDAALQDNSPSDLPNAGSIHREVIDDLYAVRANPHDGSVETPLGLALEPARRAPRVTRWITHQTVMHRVAVHVIQPGKIRAKIGEMRIPILEPDTAARSRIVDINFLGCDRVQMADQSRKRVCLLLGCGDKVVVIRKYGPCLKFPAV